MEPRIEMLQSKRLVGLRMTMSLVNNKTGELWKAFMIRRKEIQNTISSVLYSVQVYAPSYYQNFNPQNTFEKWATIEVSDVEKTPAGMETMLLPEGLYAIFVHFGGPSKGAATFQYIFTQWLPKSDYELDNRPHFEALGEKYKGDSPESEEEIYIPIKAKV